MTEEEQVNETLRVLSYPSWIDDKELRPRPSEYVKEETEEYILYYGEEGPRRVWKDGRDPMSMYL